MSNGYDVQFEITGSLRNYLDEFALGNLYTTDPSNLGGLVKLMCDEAQLPNTQAATGQLQGRYLGENQVSYPYARFFTDFSLSWMCDVNMSPLKFVTAWHNFIFDGGARENGPIKNNTGSLMGIKGENPRLFNRAVRLKYPNKYAATVRITKTDQGPQAPNQRAGISYIMEECYPYSIDSVPLSYGTSQLTRVSANFYYAKHSVVYQNQAINAAASSGWAGLTQATQTQGVGNEITQKQIESINFYDKDGNYIGDQ